MSLDLDIISGTAFVPKAGEDRPLTRKDFTSDQEVRWCPGCGDYGVLAAFQAFFPELGIAPENLVVISGIGCSSRFPYYVDSYGMHSIHGRAPSIATGVAASREDLSVWVMTGDGDALAIGGNHVIHALRRNVNLNIVMFNNEIYGLTKGQYSPTSPEGTLSKSSPLGSVDHPFNPIQLALGSGATFVARTLATDRKHLTETLRQAAAHRGAAFVEVLQNCVIFNDGTFDELKQEDHLLRMNEGEALVSGERCVVFDPKRGLVIANKAEVAEDSIMRHDATIANPGVAMSLASLGDAERNDLVAIGVFRNVKRSAYDDDVREQINVPLQAAGGTVTDADLTELFTGKNAWTID